MKDKFFFVNGSIASSKTSLLKEASNLTDVEFYHHVNESRNDFYNYILNSLNDKQLANLVKDVKSQEEFIDAFSKSKTIKKKVVNKGKKRKSVVSKATPSKAVSKTVKSNKIKESKSASKDTKSKSSGRILKRPRKSISYVNREDPSEFILKELLLGVLIGLFLGFILMSVLLKAGVLA